MVLHNPSNWHWVTKAVDAKPWLEEQILKGEESKLQASNNGVTAAVSSLLSLDGDAEVSQRKGKVITIFDLNLKLEYKGKVPKKSEVEGDEDATNDISGTIGVEFDQDMEEDEYVFDIQLYSEDASKQPAKDLVKKEIVPQLRRILAGLGPALIAEHGKSIQHAAGEDPSATFTKTKTLQSSSINKSASTSSTTTQHNTNGAKVNTTSLSDEQEFRTSADQLFETFTNPERIAAFTRSPPKVWEGGPTGKFELFGGNVVGSFVKQQKPDLIVQKWRLAQWPAGHFSTLSIKFEQNNVDAVTIMRVDWEGVPVGQEEPTKRNWSEYYVRSIKTTFGFGTVL